MVEPIHAAVGATLVPFASTDRVVCQSPDVMPRYVAATSMPSIRAHGRPSTNLDAGEALLVPSSARKLPGDASAAMVASAWQCASASARPPPEPHGELMNARRAGTWGMTSGVVLPVPRQ